MTIGTLRPEAVDQDHPLLSLEQQLRRDGLVHALLLPRLSAAHVETLVAEMSGVGAAVQPLARRIFRETEGNPFFITELVRSLFESGSVREEDGIWHGDLARIAVEELPLPTGLSDAIQARVGRLPAPVREALSIAAVLGREFDFDPLDAVLDQEQEATLEALDELLRRRLIEEGAGATARDFAFSRHKIQEVIYTGIPRRRRQRAHALVGQVMERIYEADRETVAGELAHHFLLGRLHDRALTQKAIAHLQEAGDQARTSYAFYESIDHYEQAVSLLKDERKYEQAARTLMKLGLTYHTVFAFDRARRAYEEAFALRQRAGATKSSEPLAPAPHPLRWYRPEPSNLDPGRWTIPLFSDSPNLYSGLVGVDPVGTIVPDVAESWEIVDSGRTYVFHLRDDVRWTDGTLVTATDFEHAWKRFCHPDTPASAAAYVFDISGARAFHQREVTDAEHVGVRALDNLTLRVSLEEPAAHFMYLLTTPKLLPVPRHVVESRPEAWANPENLVTNGPFRLIVWEPGRRLVLERNPTYHGRFAGNVQRVELSSCPGWPVPDDWCAKLLRAFENGEDDFLRLAVIAPEEHARIRQRHAADLVCQSGASVTSYIEFDVKRPPFDDRRVRRAFAHAVDRDALDATLLHGFHPPATGGVVPPALPGHSPDIGLPYNPAQVRLLLAQAGYLRHHGTLELRGVAPSAPAVAEYVSTRWREILGVDITWTRPDVTAFLERWHTMGASPGRLSLPAPHLWMTAQVATAPDPFRFLQPRTQRAYTGWNDDRFETLVARARRASNRGERLDLYQQADRLLMDEVAVLPLGYSGGGPQHWCNRGYACPGGAWAWTCPSRT